MIGTILLSFVLGAPSQYGCPADTPCVGPGQSAQAVRRVASAPVRVVKRAVHRGVERRQARRARRRDR